jgi:hypothetical protein
MAMIVMTMTHHMVGAAETDRIRTVPTSVRADPARRVAAHARTVPTSVRADPARRVAAHARTDRRSTVQARRVDLAKRVAERSASNPIRVNARLVLAG